MDVAGLVVAIVAALAAIAGAIFTGVQAAAARADRKDAEAARDESRVARDESARLSREANSAFARQADALERANELIEAATPKKSPEFTFQQVGDRKWAATNSGNEVAYRAQLHVISGIVHLDENEPRDLTPGDSLFLVAMKASGSQPRVRLTFLRREGNEMIECENEISIP